MRGRRFKNTREWLRACGEEDESKLVGLSPGGAAAKLKVTREYVYKLIQAHKLDAVKIGRGRGFRNIVYITEESIDRFLRERKERLKISA